MQLKPALVRAAKVVGIEDPARRCWRFARKLVRASRQVDSRLVSAYFRDAAPWKGLHIGCGDHLMPGWLNSDFYPINSDVVHLDATRRFPFPDGVFDYVFSEHMIEHVPYDSGKNMMRECFRVLKPGGQVRIATPDFDFLIGLYGRRSEINEKYVEWFYSENNLTGAPSRHPLFVIDHFMRSWGHEFIYDEPSLEALMLDCGFMDVTRRHVRESENPVLRHLENTERLPDGFLALESIILEGTKP